VIEGVGTLEFVEVDVAPSAPARVLRMHVSEGDAVRAGDTIALLSIPTLNAELAQGHAVEALARANLDELEAGAREREIERAEAELAARTADVIRLADDSTRLAPLVAQSLAAEAELVASRNAVLAAAAQRDAASATLKLLREGTRTERIAAGRADLARARANIAVTEATARDLVLLATIDGVVVTRSAEPGEVIAAGRAVATLAEVRKPWVRVYLGPRHLPLVNIGDSATAVLDAFPDRAFRGRVTAVAARAEYTPRVALTERERADLLYGVRVDFDDTTGMLKAGLPVTVRFAARALTR
jgi:HlyD family secretion protein